MLSCQLLALVSQLFSDFCIETNRFLLHNEVVFVEYMILLAQLVDTCIILFQLSFVFLDSIHQQLYLLWILIQVLLVSIGDVLLFILFLYLFNLLNEHFYRRTLLRKLLLELIDLLILAAYLSDKVELVGCLWFNLSCFILLCRQLNSDGLSFLLELFLNFVQLQIQVFVFVG